MARAQIFKAKIDKDILPQLFSPEAYLEETTNTNDKGMGLIICKKILEKLDSNIWVEYSKVEDDLLGNQQGTTIGFTFKIQTKLKHQLNFGPQNNALNNVNQAADFFNENNMISHDDYSFQGLLMHTTQKEQEAYEHRAADQSRAQIQIPVTEQPSHVRTLQRNRLISTQNEVRESKISPGSGETEAMFSVPSKRGSQRSQIELQNIPVQIEEIKIEVQDHPTNNHRLEQLPQQQNKRFLISEDDFTRRSVIQYKLCFVYNLAKEEDVVFVDDGKEALNELKGSIRSHLKNKNLQANEPKQKGLFDAIMLNYEMSSLNGLAVIRKCQDKFQMKNLQMPKVVLLASPQQAINYQKVWGNFSNNHNPIDQLINRANLIQDLEQVLKDFKFI